MGDVGGGGCVVTAPQFRCHDHVIEFAGDPGLVARLEPCFVDLGTDPVADPQVWTVEAFRAHARVTVEGREVVPWVPRDRLAPSVISALSSQQIAADPTRLHLHAAAVVDDDRSMLLVASSGSGKSTLTCGLVAAGARYRTDETVAVTLDGLAISTYPKPISVKASGIEAAERITGLTCPPGATSWEIPAGSFGQISGHTDIDGDRPVSTLAFNSYRAGQPTRIEQLHRATAVRTVLSDSQDAELVGPRSLLAAASLARSARCVRISGGDAAQVAQTLLAAHRTPFEAGEVTAVDPPTLHAGPARAIGVGSVVVDGRAVLYTPQPHRLIELDESQTMWWVLFDGTPLAQTVDELAAELATPRAQLTAAADAALEAFHALGVLSERKTTP